MAVLDSHFSNFIDGGSLVVGDTVVGLRAGLNTKFVYTGGVGVFLPLAGGTMTGSIDMNGNEITNLPTPSNPLDAVNKAYADTLASGLVDSVTGTTNQIDVNNTDPANPIILLSSTINLPGTFNIQSTTAINKILDEDNMISNSATALATQQSIKAYVDTMVGGASPLTTKGDLYSFTTVNARLPVGTIDGQIVQVHSAAATGLAWSTATYPATTTINQILYSSANNVIGAISSLANGVLVTDNSSVPQFLANGTAGYVLTANSGAPPSWQSITAEGAVTQINTDAGNITPSSGIVTMTGASTGLTTSGSGSTLSLTGVLNLASGGTNANLTASNGGIFYSTGSAAAILSGTATASKMLLSGSSSTPSWSTSTIPTSAGATANKLLLSDGTNYVLSTPTFPNASATARKMIVSDGTNWVASTETWAVPGTSGNILKSDGTNWTSATAAGIGSPLTTKGDIYTFSTVNDRLPIATGDGKILQVSSGSSTGLAWSTAIYPATSGTSANVLVSDGTNWSSSTTTGITALGAQAQALNMNSHLINNVLDPVSAQDAATKNYVDQTALNGTSVYAASAATLGTVTQSGAGVGATLTNAGTQATFALDGVNPPVGSSVLIKNTATGMTAANEGIYTVTSAGSGASNWVLTRATDYDTATEINNTGLILVQNGSTLAGTAWYNAATIVTVDTTSFSYSEFGNIVFPISLAHGGTGANLTAVNGGIVYSNASTFAITSAAASSVLVTSAGSVPSLSTTLPNGISATNMILTTPTVVNFINDFQGQNMLGFVSTNGAGAYFNFLNGKSGVDPVLSVLDVGETDINFRVGAKGNGFVFLGANGNANGFAAWSPSSSVNYILAEGAVASSAPNFSAFGTDMDISINVISKGIGGVAIKGIGTNTNAAAGYVGEFVTSNIAQASSVSCSNNTARDITSISLTAGDWDVFANVYSFFSIAGTYAAAWCSLTSGTLPDLSMVSDINLGTGTLTTAASPTPYLRVSLSTTTNVYLSCQLGFGSGTGQACGTISARRVR